MAKEKLEDEMSRALKDLEDKVNKDTLLDELEILKNSSASAASVKNQ